MITWYKDTDIEIIFNKEPNVSMRYATPENNEKEIKEINKKPFINNENLEIRIIDKIQNKEYNFLIPKGYVWDGASIPRFFWRLIGSKTEPKFLIPSLIHDILCENHDYIDNDRYFSTCVFERLLFVSKVNAFNRWMIKHSVDNYQKFCNWT